MFFLPHTIYHYIPLYPTIYLFIPRPFSFFRPFSHFPCASISSSIISFICVGRMAQWKRIRLRIWGLQVRSLLCSSFSFPFFFLLVYLILPSPFLSLNGNVAQSVERKSHNLKVVSSILTVPTFFYLFSYLYFFLYVILLYIFLFLFLYGHMAQWKRIRLRIWGLQVRPLLCSSFYHPLIFVYLNAWPLFISLNGNVAQSVERKSHNLKVVSSILTVPTFFTFFVDPTALLFCYT